MLWSMRARLRTRHFRVGELISQFNSFCIIFLVFAVWSAHITHIENDRLENRHKVLQSKKKSKWAEHTRDSRGELRAEQARYVGNLNLILDIYRPINILTLCVYDKMRSTCICKLGLTRFVSHFFFPFAIGRLSPAFNSNSPSCSAWCDSLKKNESRAARYMWCVPLTFPPKSRRFPFELLLGVINR